MEIHQDIFGQKQAGGVWKKYLVDILVKELGFKQLRSISVSSTLQKQLISCTQMTQLAFGPDTNKIQKVNNDLADFLVVNVERQSKRSTHLSTPQPHD
jgi:hypothetical protein